MTIVNFRLRAVLIFVLAAALSCLAITAVPAAATAAQGSEPGPSARSMPNVVPSSTPPSVDNGDVQSIVQVGGTMVIGGAFTQVAGQTRNHVAAFNAQSGALTSFAPSVNGIVYSVAPGPNDHSVYVGGDFTQIDGKAVTDLALLDLNTGAIAQGWTSPSFNWGAVRDLVLKGDRLYVGGTFSVVGGKAHAGLASLNATSGAVDPFLSVQLSGQHNPQTTGWIGPRHLSVSPDGSRMVVVGNFMKADDYDRDQVVMIDLTGTSASVQESWATQRYAPTCFSWAFSDTVRDVAFSPDGSYFVITATGGGNPGTLCDAAARFETNATGDNVQPTWVAETGGDTFWAVTVTDAAVYVGGHERWGNNPLGVDQSKAGAVPRPGLAALDPVSGRPLSWNPGRVPLGKFVYTLLATQDGLWLGTNTDWIGNRKYKRPKMAFFPYSGGVPLAETSTGKLPGSLFVGGQQTQQSGQTNVLYRVNAGGPTLQSLDTGPNWAADTDATSPYRNSGSNAAPWDPGATVDSTVPATTPSAIFDSERWDPAGDPEMEWSFDVTPGTPIEVRLYMANRCDCTSGAGQRVFNVSLDGQPWLVNEDLVADVGDQTGTMKKMDLNAPADGTVDIQFTHVTENPLVDGIEIVRTDVPAPPASDASSLNRIGFDGTTASTPQEVDNGNISWQNTRGAFMVGPTVFYGYTDGYLHSRTFDGVNWGADQKIDPYNDPAWAGVSTGVGDTTFDGTPPSLYSQIQNITGMFYLDGRLYYTLFGDSQMHWRWFSPDSGIVDETNAVVSSSVNFSDADGMFYSNGKLYFVTKSDGNLQSVDFENGTVTGSPTVMSGPNIDGINWGNRSLFLFNGTPAGLPNQAPSAVFTSQCDGAGCAFDGSGSSDPDGSITSYSWDFGDGKSASGVSPSHSYSAAGDYTVTLTVKDNDGATDSVSHGVTVEAPPANATAFVGAAHSDAGAAKFKQLKVPAEASVGDTMVLFFTQATDADPVGPSGVTGWTKLDSFTNASVTSTVWKKVVAPGDAGATVRMDYSTYQKGNLSLVVYSGVDASKLDASAVAHAGDSNTSEHVSPVLDAAPGDWVVSYWSDKSADTSSWTAPAGVVTRDAAYGTGAGRYSMLTVDSNGPVLGGSYGGLTATSDGTGLKTVMWTLALEGLN